MRNPLTPPVPTRSWLRLVPIAAAAAGRQRRRRPEGRPHRRFGLGHHPRPGGRLRPRVRDLRGHLHVPRRLAGREFHRLRPPRPRLHGADQRRARGVPDPGQRGGGELPPALVARRHDDRLRLGPGRAVEPLADGRRRGQPAGGPPGPRVAGRHAGVASERAGDRGPLEHPRPAPPVGSLPLPPRWRERGGTGGRRRVRAGELAGPVGSRDPLFPLCAFLRARPGPGRHADPGTRPRDRQGLRRDRGTVPAAVPGVERRRDRARTVPRRTLARLRAPYPGRHDLVQGPPLRTPHRALPARSPHRGRAAARRSHRDRPRRGHEDRTGPPRLFLEPGQLGHLRAAGRTDRQGGRRQRRHRGSPVRRRGPAPGLRTGPRGVRHLGRHLPGEDDPLAGGFAGWLGGGLPRRRTALPDDAAGRRPRAPDPG